MKSSSIKKTCLEAELECSKSALSRTEEKVNQIAGKLSAMEEKLENLAKIIKLLQTYGETQEQEAAKIREEFREIKLRASERKLPSEIICPEARHIMDLEKRIMLLEGRITPYKNIEGKLKRIEADMKHMIERQGVDIAKEITILEQKIPGTNSHTKGNIERIEAAINEWTQRIELQLNLMQEQTEKKLAEERARREQEDNKILAIAKKVEEFCAKLGEKVLERLAAEPTHGNLEKFKGELKSRMEDALSDMMEKIDNTLPIMEGTSPFSNARSSMRKDAIERVAQTTTKLQEKKWPKDATEKKRRTVLTKRKGGIQKKPGTGNPKKPSKFEQVYKNLSSNYNK